MLLGFNETDVMNYKAIAELTKIPEPELTLTLQSLSLHKTLKLLLPLGLAIKTSSDLRKGSKERELPLETFSYNANFKHKLYRITVPQISPKETLQEEDAVEERVLGKTLKAFKAFKAFHEFQSKALAKH